MKIIFLFLISFSLIINPTIAYSKSIKSIADKIKFYTIIDCSKFNDSDKYNFEDFLDCVDQQSISSQSLTNLKEKRKVEIFDAIAIAGIINDSVDYGYVDQNNAFNNWNTFINSNYKKKTDKQKLKNILDSSKCRNLSNYKEFINCFNSEFRDYEIYQSSSIKTKERMYK